MRLLFASLIAFILTACQTVGIESDPDAPVKAVIVATGIAVDTVGVYGTLPPCVLGVKPCHDPKKYAQAKLLAQSAGAALQTVGNSSRSQIFLTAGLLYFQYEAAKTLAGSPGPTNPEAPPTNTTVATLQALNLADVLVSTADQRVRDSSGPNVTVADLLADLQKRVAALP